jgi:hypothetical protein
MKTGVSLLVSFLVLLAGQLMGQQPGSAVPATPRLEAPGTTTGLAPSADLGNQSLGSEAITTKNFQITGPLVQPFKSRRMRDFPKRVLHLVNPFARRPATEQVMDVRDYNPRAWASSISWRPGASAFSDPVTHESSMSLLAVGRR